MSILGLFQVSGSSVGIYATAHGSTEAAADVLAGPPRPIRSDEWFVRTPWVLRQFERGFPEHVLGGVGVHDAAVLYDLPVSGWEVVLRPQTAGYRFLDVERAFALEWWAFFAIQLLGVYALILVLTGRVAVSASAALLVTLSPVTQWWTTPATFTTIGYGSFAMALFIAAYRARTDRARIGLSVLAGLALAAFLAALYPPWQIATALVLAPIGVFVIMADLLNARFRRSRLRSLVIALAVAFGVGGLLFGSFVMSHRDAIEAISDTVYPGARSATARTGMDLRVVMSGAFDYFSSKQPSGMVNGRNQSENSSALPLLLPVAVASLGLMARGRISGSRSSAALLGCLAGGCVIAAWMFLPVPAGLGRFLLLTRVPAQRLLPALGLSGVVGLALLVSHLRETGTALSRWQWVAAVAVLGAALAWGAARYSVDGSHVNMTLAAGFAVVVVVALALSLSRRPGAGLALLVLFSLWQASFINPLQKGLDPLIDSPLRTVIDSVERRAPADAGWVGFSMDATVKGTLIAAGVNSLSGVSPYPDMAQWRILDPFQTSVEVWNRYAQVSFMAASPGAPSTFTLRGPDDVVVTVDPCSAALRHLGTRFVVTQGFEIGSCLRPIARVRHGPTYVMVYRY